ncbi:hypothetical protein [Phocaeicola paurosaccharolyticus]|uniref:hypothetical protein n=1 Tax=Phocaeicola paurosaccharolyticus TaxID=732242 RepID=UPI0011DD1DEB|nr:hypothetical protein [Phocaeicola paurosaccharolyticus]
MFNQYTNKEKSIRRHCTNLTLSLDPSDSVFHQRCYPQSCLGQSARRDRGIYHRTKADFERNEKIQTAFVSLGSSMPANPFL